MLWPKALFSDVERLLIESEGLVRLVPQFVQACEILQTFSRFRVLSSSLLVSNGERTLVERLGLCIAAFLQRAIACFSVVLR